MNTPEYAANVADMTADRFITALHLKPHIRHNTIVEAEPGRFDGAGVILDCDDETIGNIVATIRLRYPRHAFRFYRGAGRTWARI